jgi:hypothetical protein
VAIKRPFWALLIVQAIEAKGALTNSKLRFIRFFWGKIRDWLSKVALKIVPRNHLKSRWKCRDVWVANRVEKVVGEEANFWDGDGGAIRVGE